MSVRVLYSFPHRIGAGRICDTAWYQVAGLAEAGVEVLARPASVQRPLPPTVRTIPTLARGKVRVPFRVVGQHRALAIHDSLVARWLPRIADDIDLVHTWPLGARATLEAAAELGIPTVLERPNAHTRFAYEAVRLEGERLGVVLPPDHEHAYNEDVLETEEAEYSAADYLLCPSDFVVKTFRDQGVAEEKLVRHFYGFDPSTFYPDLEASERGGGLTILFVGVAAIRKGLHFALDAWLGSPASRDGTFLVAGEVLPAYGKVLAEQLAHPSIRVLGHRSDVPELMRKSDALVLPSIEEGFGLVCTEAMASGCVPLVSDACTDLCRHDVNALVHPVGDVEALRQHLTALHEDRSLLARLRAAGLAAAPSITWSAAGERLAQIYGMIVRSRSARPEAAAVPARA